MAMTSDDSPLQAADPIVDHEKSQSQFCHACGTYIQMFRPARGRWRRVCPRCHPERLVKKRDHRDYVDRTGMPCKDRGKCRPERCVNALECKEMAK